ncbi:MAG: chemotaxis protein CheD [Nitrospirota bacterium]|nr:chemotaxis protein CheD [Nitrospirota bacterium]
MTTLVCAQPLIYLKMGEITFTEQPATITTVLGSCVAVTLYDRKRNYGAMCHGVMPACVTAEGCPGACPQQGHYVECSVEAMAKRFSSFGSRTGDIEARIFGGAEVFAMPTRFRGLLAVGPQNVEAAVRALSRQEIAVSSMAVGGRAGCRIYFDTISGEVSVWRLEPALKAEGGA